MILNHKDAIEFLVADSPDIGFNQYTILSLHALLSNNLLPNPASSGALRKHSVGIAGSVEEIFELLLEKAASIEDPFEQAFFVMVQLPYLQPFEDVNKRVSRLAANIPLNKKNLAPLSCVEVPDKLYINGLLGIYELNRVDLLKDLFLWAYERSAKQYAAQRQTLGEPDPFRMKYRDSIRAIIAEIITKPHTKAEAIQLISLHKGNFARYFVTSAQYKHWRVVWDGS